MTDRIVAIHQPFAYPWLGFFAKIVDCDVFIYLEQVQFQVKDYMRRNYYRGPAGRVLLSIPCEKPHDAPIDTIRIAGRNWIGDHKKTFETYYRKAPHFDEVAAWLFPVLDRSGDSFVELAQDMVVETLRYLGQRSDHLRSQADYPDVEEPTQRLIELVLAEGGAVYRTGKHSLETYIDCERFRAAGIRLEAQVAKPQPYRQCFPGFEPNLMAVDAMMCLGAAGTVEYMRQCFTYEEWIDGRSH